MYNIININPVSISSAQDLVRYKEFVKNNISQISMVKMDHTLFFADISSVIGSVSCDFYKELRFKLFNNSFMKSKAPMSTMELSSEVADYLLAHNYVDSIAVILYAHDIPLFINGVDYIDRFFSSGLSLSVPLVSNEDDFGLISSIVGGAKYAGIDVDEYFHSGYEPTESLDDCYFFRYDEIIGSEYINKLDCNKLLRDYYGKS